MQRSAVLELKVDSKGAVTGFAQFDAAAKNAKSSASSVTSTIRALAAAMAAFAVIAKGKEVLDLAARYETLGVVMGVVGRNAGYTMGQMLAFEQSLRRTGISAIESRNNLARMAQSHLDLSKATALGRVAQDAAVIGNLNSSETFERLIMGIQRSEILMLRTIGINADFTAAYRRTADEVGRSVESFSTQEKATIRMNEVLQVGSRIAGAYEASMATAGKQLQSTKRYAEDAKVAVGTAFLPEYTRAVFAYANMLKWMGDNSSMVVGGMTGIAAAVGLVTTALIGSKLVAMAFAATPVGLTMIIALTAIATLVGAIATKFAEARKAASTFAEAVPKMEDSTLAANLDAAVTESAAIARRIKDRQTTGIGIVGTFSGELERDRRDKAELKRLTEIRTQLEAERTRRIARPPGTPGGEGGDTSALEAFKNDVAVKTAEIAKQRELNAAFGQTEQAIRILTIRREAEIEKIRNAKDLKGEELAQMNRLVDRMAVVEIQSVKLASAETARQKAEEQSKRVRETVVDLEERNRQEKELLATGIANVNLIDRLAVAHAGLNAVRTAGVITDPAEQERLRRAGEEQARLAIERRKQGEDISVAKDAARDATTAQENVEKAKLQVIKNYVRMAQQTLSTGIAETLENGIKSWKSFFDNVRRMLVRLVADMIAQKIMDRVTSGLMPDKQDIGTKQLIAGSTMQTAAQLQVQAANTMLAASGKSQLPGVDGGDIPGAPGGMSRAGKGAGVAAASAAVAFQVGGMLGNMTTSKVGGAAMGAAGGAAAGALIGTMMLPGLGTAIGAVVGGLFGLVGGLLGASAAAKRAAAEARAFAQNSAALAVSFEVLRARQAGRSTSLIEALEQNRRYFDQLEEEIRRTYSGRRRESDRFRLYGEAERLEQAEASRIRKEWEASQLRRTEDIEVRRLSALGMTKEAEALKLTLDQQREYDSARQSGYTDAMLAQLLYVQGLEKVAAAAQQATASMLNLPTGFKIAAAIFNASAPLSLIPTQGGVSSAVASAGSEVPIVLVMDGQQVAKGVVKNLQKSSQRQYGTTTRWNEVQ